MSNYARWERESQERLDMPQPRAEETAEFDVTTTFDEPSLDDAQERDSALTLARHSVSDAAARVGRWFAGLDRREFELDDETPRDPVAELTAGATPTVPRIGFLRRARSDDGVFFAGSEDEGSDAVMPGDDPADSDPADAAPFPRDTPRAPRAERPPESPEPDSARFPTAPLGYNRQAVDQAVAALEREVADLRRRVDPPISITEEIERIGEQTASILVVAHDKAHETTRLAQEQAERCVQDAASNAVAITAEAKRRLRELDEETDAVWRERERLLEDVRVVSGALHTLADDASERFPADAKTQVDAE